MPSGESTPQLSLAVVIPTFQEETSLGSTLESLLCQSEPADQILVVDGGSQDHTTTIALSFGAKVIVVPRRGRGGQIAAGLLQLDEAIVVVAHADMLFPSNALQSIRQYLVQHPRCPGGCLGHSFHAPKRIYRVIEWFDRRRALRGISYGDQCQFFRRHLLDAMGGFPDQPILEDLELSLRLRRLGSPAYLNLPVRVSPRRFERRGILRCLLENWAFRLLYYYRGPAACSAIFHRYYGRPLRNIQPRSLEKPR